MSLFCLLFYVDSGFGSVSFEFLELTVEHASGNDAGGYIRNRHTVPHSVYSPEKRKDKQTGNQNQYLTT